MSDREEISLFPIPNVVAFPGTVMPLHVFEPRYRALINDAVDQNRMIGVCHTVKEIRSAPVDQSLEQALSTNQATYLPVDVFSAGTCEILETTDDGRILANIHISRRFVAKEEIQTLPYRVVTAEELRDDPLEDDLQAVCAAIHDLLINLIAEQHPASADAIREEKWEDLPCSEYSFKIFQVLRFDSDIMQSLLSLTSAAERLQRIYALLTGDKFPLGS